MRAIVISDTHFGDPYCSLVQPNGTTYRTTATFDRFLEIATDGGNRTVDYLILLGDVLDFSVAGYAVAFSAAAPFFRGLWSGSTPAAQNIVLVPGNHDFDLWSMIEFKLNLTSKIENGDPPRHFKGAVPGVLDFDSGVFNLVELSDNGGGSVQPHGNWFMDRMTASPDGPGVIPVAVAFPNLYVRSGGISMLLTHGHYLEGYWSLASEVAAKIAELGSLDIKDIVQINHPLNQLACSGLGQSGKLLNLAKKIQVDVKKGKLKDVQRHLRLLQKEVLDPAIGGKWYSLKEVGTDIILSEARKAAIKELENYSDVRFDEEFKKNGATFKRAQRYLKAALHELDDINEALNPSPPIPNPNRVIFGHTHDPIAWRDTRVMRDRFEGQRVIFHNTGGWLDFSSDGGPLKETGAEIFILDSTPSFSASSERIKMMAPAGGSAPC